MKIVYTNIKSSGYDLGQLKSALKKAHEEKTFINFVLTEINARRDAVLCDSDMNDSQKIGALTQLRELYSFFFGGIAAHVEKMLQSELRKIHKADSNEITDKRMIALRQRKASL